MSYPAFYDLVLTIITSMQPVQLWTGKQVISTLVSPHKNKPIKVNLRAKGKQYTTGEDLCYSDGCKMLFYDISSFF